MFDKFKRKAVENYKRTVKEQVIQCMDDTAPIIFGLVSVVVIVVNCIPQAKPAATMLTVNNYYF